MKELLSTGRVVYVQISDELTSTDTRCREYYDLVYDTWFDTKPPRHFMEIPTWIPICDGRISPIYERQVYVVANLKQAIEYFNGMPDAVLLFSVLDINKTVVQYLVHNVWNTCLVGGYITGADRERLEREPNVYWLSHPDELKIYLRPAKIDSPNYALFSGIRTFPRITLSEGCLHNCAFCSIPRKLVERHPVDILTQANTLLPLDFDYIYVDDKTFGQADNYTILLDVWNFITMHKPGFKGFIVQTTVPVATKLLKAGEIEKLHIAALEVGVEIPNDDYLRKMRKPYNLKQLNALHDELRFHPGLIFIPNIIFGAPGDNYADTLTYLSAKSDTITFVNPYVLTLYGTAKGDMGITSESSRYDVDETTVVKSWLSLEEQELTKAVLDWCLRKYEHKAYLVRS